MEILGTQLKETEVQAPETNYNCRLPRDVNLGVNPNARSKGETDINLLVACKVQLSSEVIRWKTETLRLQKERDSAQQHSKELDQLMSKLTERTKDLEDRLMQVEDENKFLKSTNVNAEQEKAVLIQKISHNLTKYHSFPWLEIASKPEVPRLHRLETSESRKVQFSPQEDWREVSQKMLQQMKNEMKELQEMSFCNLVSDKENSQNISSDANGDSKGEPEGDLSNLLSETISLKHVLLGQQQKLKLLLHGLTSNDFPKRCLPAASKSRDQDLPCADAQNLALRSNLSGTKPRLSEEEYRLHFTKQLENTRDADKMAKKVQHFLKNPKLCGLHNDSTDTKQSVISPSPIHSEMEVTEEVRSSEKQNEDSEKVCPICHLTFDAAVSQADFEDHVVNHLETESASLLDQYVIV